jgi:hypothetical protein
MKFPAISAARLLGQNSNSENRELSPRYSEPALVTSNHADIVPAQQLGRCLLNLSRNRGVHPIRSYIEGTMEKAAETTELVPVNDSLPKRVRHRPNISMRTKSLSDDQTMVESIQPLTETTQTIFERSEDRPGDAQVLITSSAFSGIERALNDMLAGLESTGKGWNITGAYHVNPSVESDAGYYDSRVPEDVAVLPDNSNCADCVIINSRI